MTLTQLNSGLAAEFASTRNVWAVGRNYSEHAKELGNAVPQATGAPMFFLKAGSSIVANGEKFHLPKASQDIHHEVEVALRFAADGSFDAITLAIDLTARDVQNELKAKGHPWTLAKSFREACLMGPVQPLPKNVDLNNIDFDLKVNGEVRQRGNTRDMIHNAEKLRVYVLENFPVAPGDWLLTGTPQGVAQLRVGDHLEASIEGLVKANWHA